MIPGFIALLGFALGVALPLQEAHASAEPGHSELPPEIAAMLQAGGRAADLAALRRSAGIDLRGWSCPVGGCKANAPTRVSDIAAFGGALLGGVWLSRRRTQHRG